MFSAARPGETEGIMVNVMFLLVLFVATYVVELTLSVKTSRLSLEG